KTSAIATARGFEPQVVSERPLPVANPLLSPTARAGPPTVRPCSRRSWRLLLSEHAQYLQASPRLSVAVLFEGRPSAWDIRPETPRRSEHILHANHPCAPGIRLH